MSNRDKVNRGYFGIGIYCPKRSENVGTLWRSAHNFGASFIFIIGPKYKYQSSDTSRAWQKIPLFHYPNWETFEVSKPKDCITVGIEQSSLSTDLRMAWHFPRSIYVLGSEDTGLHIQIQNCCNRVLHISTPMCLNVAAAGSIVMYDRHVKLAKQDF